jgi:RNA recognition motif-containing protein
VLPRWHFTDWFFDTTGNSMGYGFVKFETDESATAAISALNGLQVGRKTLKVSIAREEKSNIYLAGTCHRSSCKVYECQFASLTLQCVMWRLLDGPTSGFPLTWDRTVLENLMTPFGKALESRILVGMSCGPPWKSVFFSLPFPCSAMPH